MLMLLVQHLLDMGGFTEASMVKTIIAIKYLMVWYCKIWQQNRDLPVVCQAAYT